MPAHFARRLALVVAAFIALTGSGFVHALDPAFDLSQLGHRAWRNLDGFGLGTIVATTQTTDGYLWFATPTGVVRFDGVRSVPWHPRPGTALPDDSVRALLGSRDGALWIGTLRGLARLKDGELVLYPSLQDKAVNAIEEDADGTLWVGGISWSGPPENQKGFLCAIRRDGSECHGDDGSLGRSVAGLYHDRSNALWVLGIDRVWKWGPSPRASFDLPSTVNTVRTITGTPDGAVLVATQREIVSIAADRVEVLPLPNRGQRLAFTKILLDRDGALWLGVVDGGLLRLHNGRLDAYTASDGLSGDQVLDLFEDHEGNIWVSTSRGLDQFRSAAGAIYSSSKGLEGRPRAVLAARDGRVWAATTTAIYRIDGRRAEEIRRGPPGSLFEDRAGRIWLYSSLEFGHFERDRFLATPGVPAGAIEGVAEDSKGNIWVAHREAGLLRLSPDGTVKFTPWASLGRAIRVSTLAVDPSDDSIWLGSWSGEVMNVADGQVRSFIALGQSRDSPRVSQVRIGADGTLWVSNGNGLVRVRRGQVTRLDTNAGMPCDRVLETIDDGTAFWIYARCGLIRVSRVSMDAWSDAADQGAPLPKLALQWLDQSNGVPQTERFAVGARLTSIRNTTPFLTRAPDGHLWVKTGEGFVLIDPQRIPTNGVAPVVHIEQVTGDRRTYPPQRGLRLPPLQRDLTIDYTGLSFTAPERVQFRYRLEGRDADWQDVGQRRQAFYSDLPPGQYRFRVMAANANGEWSREDGVLDFSVEPAWWQTAAFRVMCVAAVALMLYLLYRLRISQLSWRLNIVESVPGLVLTLTPTGGIEFINGGTVSYLGMDLTAAKKWATNGIVHPEDMPRVGPLFKTGVSAGEPFEYEVRLRHSDGMYRWFQLRAHALRNSAGIVLRWYVLLTDIDQLKRAEEAQRHSERELGLIVDTIPALVVICTATGVVEFENNRTREYLGPELASTGEWASNGIVCPDDMPRVGPLFEAGVRGGEPFEYEVRLRHESGTYRWFQLRASPLRDANGGVLRWYCLLTDIHEKRRVEQALRESEVELRRSESNLRLTIDTIPALAWSARADGTADFFNQHYLEYVGSSSIELRDWNWTTTLHPDDLDVIADAWERFRAARQGGSIEARIRRHDGVYRWFLFRANPLLDSSGNVIKWFGVHTDIEDRKVAEAALKRSETFLAEGQRISSTGSFSWRLATDELTFSDELDRIFGFEPGTVVSFDRIAQRVHPEDHPLLAERMAEVRSGQDNAEYEIRLRMPDETVKHVRVFGRVFRQLDGTLECLGAVQDVTRRKIAEDALGKVRSELAHVTRMMSFSALTASIAHEVNQPLAGIITNASACVRMLAATPPDVAGAMETARRTIRDGNRASEVVVRLRKLFSKETQRSERVDLNQAAAEVIALVAGDLQRNQVAVETDFADSLPTVAADRVQLQQVILNLVTNASDAMRAIRGRPRIVVIRTARDGNERVRLSVQDTGVGIRSEDVEQVFQPFFTTKSSGMGIGLSVSRSIIESHNGRLWVEPDPNGGAIFAFSIPVTSEANLAS